MVANVAHVAHVAHIAHCCHVAHSGSVPLLMPAAWPYGQFTPIFPVFLSPEPCPSLFAEDFFAASCTLILIFQIPSKPDLVFI